MYPSTYEIDILSYQRCILEPFFKTVNAAVTRVLSGINLERIRTSSAHQPSLHRFFDLLETSKKVNWNTDLIITTQYRGARLIVHWLIGSG